MDNIKKILEQTIIQNEWERCNQQCRAFFTTLVYISDWEVGTVETDNYLLYLYNTGAIEDLDILFDEFQAFMIELIV